jgi:hypothetical protein
MLAVFAVNVAASGGLATMFPVVTTENQVGGVTKAVQQDWL